MNEMGVMGGGGSRRFETPEEYKTRKSLWATPERGTHGGAARGLSARKLRNKMAYTFRIPYFECTQCGSNFEVNEGDLLEDEYGKDYFACPECSSLFQLVEDDDDDEEGEEPKKVKVTPDIVAKITQFLRDNPDPSDDDFHDLADDLGMHPSQAEEIVYKIAHKLMKKNEADDSGKGGITAKTMTPEMYTELVKFIEENPEADEEDFYDLADDLGIKPEQAKKLALEVARNLSSVTEDDDEEEDDEEEKKITWKDLKCGTVPDDNFNGDELDMGIEVEKEHYDDEDIAKAIAKAHLTEFPDYYTRLKKMETEAKAAKTSKASKDFLAGQKSKNEDVSTRLERFLYS